MNYKTNESKVQKRRTQRKKRVGKNIIQWFITLFTSHRIDPIDLGGKSG
jgi:hypothetical protein